MARLVSVRGPRGKLNAAGEEPAKERLQDYLERVAKWVPAEILAAFLLIRGFAGPFGEPGSWPAGVHIGVYVALVIATPIYFLRVGEPVPKRGWQALICT